MGTEKRLHSPSRLGVRFATVAIVATASGASLLTGCAGSTTPTTTSTVTVKETASSSVTPSLVSTPPSASPVPPAPAVAAGPWTMPNLIGRDLQSAQNAIQALTDFKVFYSGSTDLTGKGRMQMVDRNWQVCTSTPPSGSTITEQTSIEFGVVKDDESCP